MPWPAVSRCADCARTKLPGLRPRGTRQRGRDCEGLARPRLPLLAGERVEVEAAEGAGAVAGFPAFGGQRLPRGHARGLHGCGRTRLSGAHPRTRTESGGEEAGEIGQATSVFCVLGADVEGTLQQPQALEVVEGLGDRDPGEAADLRQGLVGEVHVP